MHFPRPFDPVVTFRNSQGEPARGTLTTVQRRSLVLEVYNPYSIVQVSEVLSDVSIRQGERAVYEGKAVVVSLLNTGLMALVSLTLIDEWNDLGSGSWDPGSVSTAVQRFVDDWDSRPRVKPAYQDVINDLRGYLSEVTRWLDQADAMAGFPRKADGKVRDDVFDEIAAPLLVRAARFQQQFEAVAATLAPEEESIHRSFAQAAIHPLVLRAPFVYRTFAKPLGYAGDYEMVNQILGDPRQGPTTYFELVNFMFLQASVARAHRNRVDILHSRLRDVALRSLKERRSMRVLNVGCGPVGELQRLAVDNVPLDGLDIVLMDFSEETLVYARKAIDDAAAMGGRHFQRVTLRNESVHQLLKRTARSPAGSGKGDEASGGEAGFDFIYCAGLFDYLSDKACARLIQHFFDQLRAGGELLVTNVHSANPERHWMEHFMEWYLIYRDEAAMRSLFPRGSGAINTYTDATGVNLFAEVSKP